MNLWKNQIRFFLSLKPSILLNYTKTPQIPRWLMLRNNHLKGKTVKRKRKKKKRSLSGINVVTVSQLFARYFQEFCLFSIRFSFLHNQAFYSCITTTFGLIRDCNACWWYPVKERCNSCCNECHMYFNPHLNPGYSPV